MAAGYWSGSSGSPTDAFDIATRSAVASSISSSHGRKTPLRSIQRFGAFTSIVGLFLLAACGVRYGFSEGAFPSHVRTMAILPFENQTAAPELQSELFDS